MILLIIRGINHGNTDNLEKKFNGTDNVRRSAIVQIMYGTAEESSI